MRAINAFERGFLGGVATAALSIGVTLLTVGAAKRLRDRRATGTPIGIDSVPPREVELSAQPAPEGNSGHDAAPRLESEMDDVMLPSQRW
jgi:hypothetical protein